MDYKRITNELNKKNWTSDQSLKKLSADERVRSEVY